MSIKVYDKYRGKFAKQITTLHFDRDGNPTLAVYLDKPNKARPIYDSDKICTNQFYITIDEAVTFDTDLGYWAYVKESKCD